MTAAAIRLALESGPTFVSAKFDDAEASEGLTERC